MSSALSVWITPGTVVTMAMAGTIVIGPVAGAAVGGPGAGTTVGAPTPGPGVVSGDDASLIVVGGCTAAMLGATGAAVLGATAVAEAGDVADGCEGAAAAVVDDGEAYTTVGAGGRLSTPGSTRACLGALEQPAKTTKIRARPLISYRLISLPPLRHDGRHDGHPPLGTEGRIRQGAGAERPPT